MSTYDKNYKGSIYKKSEYYEQEPTDKLVNAYSDILDAIGEDKEREGLLKTPARASKAMAYFTHGYGTEPAEILKGAMFEDPASSMVIVKNIEMYSLCEHHLVPFFGKAHVAYIPNGHIVGLSKIPRVIDAFSRRLQVQERITHEVLDCIQQTLNPLGVAVVMEAQHLCMMMRGVQKQNSVTTTSAFTGEFENVSTRNEFISLLSASLS